MTEFKKFMDIISSGDMAGVDASLASRIADEYPFFTLPAALALKAGMEDESVRRALMAKVALNSPDGETLFRLIDPDGAKLSRFYPDETAKETTPTTDKAIDTFLDTYGKIDEQEQALLERLIFNPVPDYSQVLARDAEDDVPAEPASGQDALLDAFLAKQDVAAKHAAEGAGHAVDKEQEEPRVVTPSADAPLSESLARIYIKRRRYDKAYEIIRQLSLNFPEKSIYFADQLRFLQKLILNQKYAKQQKQ